MYLHNYSLIQYLGIVINILILKQLLLNLVSYAEVEKVYNINWTLDKFRRWSSDRDSRNVCSVRTR